MKIKESDIREYLMTYGWAIFVVIIAIYVLVRRLKII